MHMGHTQCGGCSICTSTSDYLPVSHLPPPPCPHLEPLEVCHQLLHLGVTVAQPCALLQGPHLLGALADLPLQIQDCCLCIPCLIALT
jgi:hypothetical protein